MSLLKINIKQLDITNASDNAALVYSQANNSLEYRVVTTGVQTSIDTVNANVEALPDSAANDYSTYTTVTGLIDTVQSNLTSVIGAAPSALDTLAEISAALENDANLAVTLTNSIGTVSDNVTIGTANTYNTYTTVTGLINTVQDNVATGTANTYNTYTTLDGRINTVQDNVTSLTSTVDNSTANLYNTYTSLSASIDTVQDNVAVGGDSSLSAINITTRSVSTNTTITATQGAFSVGPLEIADGVTVTVESGGRHLIL